MTFKSTEGNCGPPIVLSKAPIDQPKIWRGRTIIPLVAFDVPPQVGDRITFPMTRGRYVITFYDIEVTAIEGSEVVTFVTRADVVTWITLDVSN